MVMGDGDDDDDGDKRQNINEYRRTGDRDTLFYY
jgi:hypothetical protein